MITADLAKLSIAWVIVACIWLRVALYIASLYALVDGGFSEIWPILTRCQDVSGKQSGDASPTDSHPSWIIDANGGKEAVQVDVVKGEA